MRSRRGQSDDSISLFPFLAVLICTMGSLIVLLVLVVQQAKASATAEAKNTQERDEQNQSRLEQLRLEEESLRWKTQMMSESRKATLAEATDKRLELSHLEDHIRQLRQRIQTLGKNVQEMLSDKNSGAGESKNLQREFDKLTAELKNAEADYESAVREHASRKKNYAIVPYDGPHGTRRQPMFVECFADRLVLQPEGVALTARDFLEPITNDNPLALALRAKREYLAKVAYDEEAGEPYPLLIVRPGGEKAYAVARVAMLAWDSEFGYELIPSELELKYPKTDDALVEIVSDAAEDGRERRRQLQMMAPSRFGRARGATYRPSRGGGFERDLGENSGDGSAGDEFADDADDVKGWSRGEVSVGQAPSDGQSAFGSGGFSPERGSARTPGDTNHNSGPQESSEDEEKGSTRTSAKSGDSQGSPARGSGQGNAPGGSGAAGASGSSVFAGQPFSAGGKSLAGDRGQGWGLPNRSVSSTGIRRPISIDCYPNRIVLPSDKKSRAQQQEFAIDGSLVDEVDRLVAELWQRMKGWGLAGTNMYWKPVLRVRVMDKAEPVFDELSRLLDGSGIEVKRK